MSTIVIPAAPPRSPLRSPVATSASLPSSGNVLGDLCVAQDTGIVYTWTAGGWTAGVGTEGPQGPQGPQGPAGSGGGGSSFTPTDLPGFTVWLRGTPLALATGDMVSTWSDPLSGGGHPFSDLGQASARATFTGNATPNGRAALLFDGVRTALRSLVTIDQLFTGDSALIAIAFKVLSVAHNNAAVYANDLVAGDQGGWIGLYLRATDPPTLYGYNWHGNGYAAPSAPLTLNTWHVAYMRHAGGVVALSVDGGDEIQAASGTTESLTAPFTVGGTGGLFSNCLVADLLINSTAISSADALRVAGYLMTYNGL